MQKIYIKGHSFVKTTTNKNPKSNAHLHIMANHSAKFQINSSIRDVAGVVGTRSESARAITPSKMAKNKKQKAHAHLDIIRNYLQNFKLFQENMKEELGTRFRTDGRMDRRTDGCTDGQTRAISTVPLRHQRVTITAVTVLFRTPYRKI